MSDTSDGYICKRSTKYKIGQYTAATGKIITCVSRLCLENNNRRSWNFELELDKSYFRALNVYVKFWTNSMKIISCCLLCIRFCTTLPLKSFLYSIYICLYVYIHKCTCTVILTRLNFKQLIRNLKISRSWMWG